MDHSVLNPNAHFPGTRAVAGKPIRLGFVALADCPPLVMAQKEALKLRQPSPPRFPPEPDPALAAIN